MARAQRALYRTGPLRAEAALPPASTRQVQPCS
jgi:hypothetical protein